LVIALTGYSFEAIRILAEQEGADFCFEKSTEPEKAIRVLNQLE